MRGSWGGSEFQGLRARSAARSVATVLTMRTLVGATVGPRITMATRAAVWRHDMLVVGRRGLAMIAARCVMNASARAHAALEATSDTWHKMLQPS